MTLEGRVRAKRKEKEILVMTHVVLGYPNPALCLRIIEAMVQAGVDLMELQVPFSEPVADGPSIRAANEKVLKQGMNVRAAMALAGEAATRFDIPFLLMTYYNIPFTFGLCAFAHEMNAKGLWGSIVPDLPMEEAGAYTTALKGEGLAPVFTFSPVTSLDRMKRIASLAEGFVYCVARKGVTGATTSFSHQLAEYLFQCRQATTLPLAVGFGIENRAHLDFLKGKADIAVIGTRAMQIADREGVASLTRFIRGLR